MARLAGYQSADRSGNLSGKYLFGDIAAMRKDIDAVHRLFEFDLSGARFYSLVVLAVKHIPEQQPQTTLVDHLDRLSLDELVVQMQNYSPAGSHHSTWHSDPIGNTTYYMNVAAQHAAITDKEIDEINQHLAKEH